MPIRPKFIIVAFFAGVAFLFAGATSASATVTAGTTGTNHPIQDSGEVQSTDSSAATTTTAGQAEGLTALPKPGTGKEPENEGERGTLSQYLVMGAIIGALGVIFVLIRRESKSKLGKPAS